MTLPSGDWYTERVSPTLIQQFKLRARLFKGASKFQPIEIVETEPMGRTLLLEEKTQSAELDEFIYHEALVHPALIAHANPKRVFIGGGGEGATLREVLRHKTVARCVMVDIDGELMEICKQYLPTWHAGAFDNPRATVIAGDALAYLRRTKEKFDVIIMDINDPLEGGPGVLLYTKDFYRMLLARLAPGGIIVTQAGPASYGVAGLHSAICNTVRKGTGKVSPYKVNMVSFASDWGYAMSGPGAKPVSLTAAEVDRRIAKRIGPKLRYYDGQAHIGMFNLPKWLREKIEKEKRTITKDTQVFLEA